MFSAFSPCCMEIKWTTLVSGQIAFHQDSEMTVSAHPPWMKSYPAALLSPTLKSGKTITEILVDGL